MLFFLDSFSLDKASRVGPFGRFGFHFVFPQVSSSRGWRIGIDHRPAPFAVPLLTRWHVEGTKVVSALLE